MSKKNREKTVKQKRNEERNKARKEETKRKIVCTMLKSETGKSSFDWLFRETGAKSRSYLNELLKQLIDDGAIVKISPDGEHPFYVVIKIPKSTILAELSCSFLFEMLEKINVSKDREKSVSEFNRYLGSLIAYVLKKYYFTDAEKILNSILPTVGSYLTYFPESFDRSSQCLVQKQEPNVESAEWNLWQDLDSGKYVTVLSIPQGVGDFTKKSQQRKNAPVDAITQILQKNRDKKVTTVKRESIDYGKFEEKWLKEFGKKNSA